MLKKFFMRQMVKSQLKDMPADQQEQILKAVEENPELFEKIAAEVQAATSGGKDQVTVAIEVLQKHKDELQKLFGGKK